MHGWKMLAAVAAAYFQINALAFAQPHSLGHTLITEWLTCLHEATDRLFEGSNEPAEMIVIKGLMHALKSRKPTMLIFNTV